MTPHYTIVQMLDLFLRGGGVFSNLCHHLMLSSTNFTNFVDLECERKNLLINPFLSFQVLQC